MEKNLLKKTKANLDILKDGLIFDRGGIAFSKVIWKIR